MSIAENYARLQLAIQEATLKNNRNPKEVTLIAVTKTVSWNEASELYAEGQRLFGESRLQEALKKQQQAPHDCQWHLIGTLQTNKVSKAVGKFNLIHSVDSLALAEKLSKYSREQEITTSILLQANTSGELTKHGLTPEEWKTDFETALSLPNLSIKGLMTMAPLNANENSIRKCFADLRNLRDELNQLAPANCQLHHLSMGMSHDFEFAIAEGATLLRIGSALFTS